MYKIMESSEYKGLLNPKGVVGELYHQYDSNGSFNLEKGLDSLLSAEKKDLSNTDFRYNIDNSSESMYSALEDMFNVIKDVSLKDPGANNDGRVDFYLRNVGLGIQYWLSSSILSAKEVNNSFLGTLSNYKNMFYKL